MTKKLILLATVMCAIHSGFAGEAPAEERTIEIDNLIVKDTILYCPDSGKAFTGRAVAYFASGLKEMEVELRNGRPHGKWTHWYENGQKKEVCDFFEGIKLGKLVGWDENGRKTGEILTRHKKVVTLDCF